VANLPGFPEKRFERNGIGQRAGGAVQPLGGGWRACPTAAVAWQVHAAGSRPQDPSEAAGSGPEKALFFGPQPDLGSVGLDLAPVPLESVEAHAAGHPLSGAIHAAFLPMQGVCVAPAPRCQRVWKHRGACQQPA
jgi:hypothetical protein